MMATNVQTSQAATRLSGHMPMKVHLAEVCLDDPGVDSGPPRPCPFCGGEPELQVREKVGGGWLAVVRCTACQACGPYVTGNECLSGLQMLAWHDWNRRSL